VKAVVFERYGSPEAVTVAEVEVPVPTGHQLLVKVQAASVNPADFQTVRGDLRVITGLRRPKRNRIGYDFAGEVIAVGEEVTRFKPGDEVFGACSADPAKARAVWALKYGAFAEQTIAYEGALALKPAGVTFEQAAAVPTTAWVALQGLRKHGKVQAGERVLISSATGGIGTLAVQIAKALGANVTGVCSTKNVELVRALGADTVIDYRNRDYPKLGQRYDVIFDSVGQYPLSTLRRILNPDGRVLVIGTKNAKPTNLRMLARLIMARILRNVMAGPSRPDVADLAFVADLLANGKLTPVIVERYSGLAEVGQALRQMAAGGVAGKIVVTI
jgi:NADPH:quinone reductase-like Zn-dependent oxidoreductase